MTYVSASFKEIITAAKKDVENGDYKAAVKKCEAVIKTAKELNQIHAAAAYKILASIAMAQKDYKKAAEMNGKATRILQELQRRY